MTTTYFYPKKIGMIHLNECTYKNLARMLNSSIGNQHYFNGRIEFQEEECNYLLRATLLIYREPLLDPSDSQNTATHIKDVVPVWWEFDAITRDGPELSDFCWREFREYLLNC